MTEPRGSCSSCDHWDQSLHPEEGKCRRYPPVPDPRGHVRQDGLVDGLYVRTSTVDWCGEWRARRLPRETRPEGEPPEGLPVRGPASEDQQPQGSMPEDPEPILDEASYARLRRLYTADELRALVQKGKADGEEEDAASARELDRLEDAFQKGRSIG